MIALEIMSSVKSVANPSAVRRTRKARMTEPRKHKPRGTEPRGQNPGNRTQGLMRGSAMSPYADAVDSVPKKT
jgi:hypothetical protein